VRFLWPVSEYRIDGIAWRTPWYWGGKLRDFGAGVLRPMEEGLAPGRALRRIAPLIRNRGAWRGVETRSAQTSLVRFGTGRPIDAD
jgi:hypothetical protein